MKSKNLVSWLTLPLADTLFGDGFTLRADTLAAILTRRETFASIARRHGVTRSAVSKIAKIQRGVISDNGAPRLTCAA